MIRAELKALSLPLSNDARVLYCLYLRPHANTATGLTEALDYKRAINLLNGKENKFSRGRQVNRLLKELMQCELVVLPNEQDIKTSLNGHYLLLPKLIESSNHFDLLYGHAKSMEAMWQPRQDILSELLSLIGVIDTQVTADETGEFIAYWRGRPDVKLSEYQWTHRFAQQIKRNRTASGMVPLKKVGTQLVGASSGVEADDNAKQLVKKYAQLDSTSNKL